MALLDKKYVLIDLDDTLFDFGKGETKALKKLFKYYGISFNEENVRTYKRINLSYWEKLERKEMTKDEILVNRFVEFFDLVGVTNYDPVKTNKMFLDSLSLKGYYMKGAIRTLKYLKKKGYIVYLISNGIEYVQKGRLNSKKKVLKYLDEIYLSDSIGYTKPDSGFIDYIIKDQNLSDMNKKEMVIIGDSLTSDILLGKKMGIDTIWFNHKNKDLKDLVPEYIIFKLCDLNKIL